jgi:hypothetical protein
MTSNGDMIDPTNSNGLIDIELKYLGGLIKVSTTLARINEPPRMPGYDVNCYVKVTNKDVAIIAESDIFADGRWYSTINVELLSVTLAHCTGYIYCLL